MTIHQKPANPANFGGKRRQKIRYLVIHYTGNDGDTARDNALFFAREAVGVSAHYFVDAQEIWQSVPDDCVAWHCGTRGTYYHPHCRNQNALGIEMCAVGVGKDTHFLPETRENALGLTRMLMKKYEIPLENVVRHYDVTHKTCPQPYVREAEGWSAFKAALAGKEDEVIIYHTLDEVPAWGQETVRHLLNRGYLAGDADGALDLEHYMLRTLVIGYRAGMYR